MSEKPGERCADCLGVLADETRLYIVRALQDKHANVSHITEEVGLTQPTVSHHLKVLGDHGFLVKEKRGRETYYTMNKECPCRECGVFWAPRAPSIKDTL